MGPPVCESPLILLEQPEDLFVQLDTFSSRVLSSLRLPLEGSPWGKPSFAQPPSGVVIHYTASEVMRGTLAWFCDKALNPTGQESAHLIVGKARYPWADAHMDGLDIVNRLPVTVIQLRKPTMQANHATWANGFTWGIENECAGAMAANQVGAAAVPLYGKLWSPYTSAQLQANVMLIQAYRRLNTNAWRWEHLLGHEHVETLATKFYASDKLDPGPLYPWAAVRAAAKGIKAMAAPDSPETVLMHALGYDGATKPSIIIAQRALGLVTDGVCGPITTAALHARLANRTGKT